MRILTLILLLSTVPLACARQPGEEESVADPANAMEALFGASLINAKGETVPVSALEGKKVGIYFSAAWCPPCRGFTPILVKAYNEMKGAGKPFEIVFVSSDRDRAAAMGYMNDYGMEWLAVPHGSPQTGVLSRRFGVRGIPMLVVVDASGKTLSTRARADVESRGAQAFDVW